MSIIEVIKMEVKTEKCNCDLEFPIVLQHHLVENAIVCSNCNLDREVSGLSDKLHEEINQWNHEYNIAFKKWLESDIKIDELSNPKSNLNELGLRITSELTKIITAYYWWNVDEDEKFDQCPKCQNELVKINNGYTGFHKVCDKCRILINE